MIRKLYFVLAVILGLCFYTCTHDMRGSIFFNDTATTEIYTLSLHDALPILKEGNKMF